MAIFRIPAVKDTSVADADPGAPPDIDVRFANVGACEIMNLYKFDNTGAQVLIQFPTSSIDDVKAAYPSSSIEVNLHLFDAKHDQTVPAGFTAIVRPLIEDWDEGDGLDIDTYTDVGAANYYLAKVGKVWTVVSGAVAEVPVFFDKGTEDVDVNVNALTSSMQHGLSLTMDFGDPRTYLYIKKFHTRQSHFPDKRPFLEIRWDDSVTGTLPAIQALRVTSGTYSGSMVPVTIAGKDQGLRLSASSIPYETVTMNLIDLDPTGSVIVSMPGLKPVFDTAESLRLNVNVQRKDWNPATIPSSSLATQNSIMTDMYYRVVDVITDTIIVPFATGTIKYTKLSYDEHGNYFNFDMGNLLEGPLYRFDFTYQIAGSWTVVPGDAFRFRLTETGNG